MRYIIALIVFLVSIVFLASTSLAAGSKFALSIASTPDTIGTGTVVTFVAQTEAVVRSYQWDMGDGTPVIGEMTNITQHIFTQPGTYTVKLTVQYKIGAPNSTTKTITVGTKKLVSGELTGVTTDKKILNQIAKVALTNLKITLAIDKENALIAKIQGEINAAEEKMKTQAKTRAETALLIAQIQDYKDKIAKSKAKIIKFQLKAKNYEQKLIIK